VRKWANELNRSFSKVVQMVKTHEEMLNFPGHKCNTNQNTKIFISLLLEWLSSRTQTTKNIVKEAG
jgi:hypothetical protein